jgi:uncharacterized membrane protein (UPF0182 family)
VYAESLFLQGRSAVRGIPELRRVILAVKDRIVMGDTYADALAQLFGAQPAAGTPTPKPTATGTPAPPSSVKSQIAEAAKVLDDADAALRKGDFAKYGELQKKGRELLKRLVESSK